MKPILIIDFDSTFIKDETLDEISNFLSSDNDLKQKIAQITDQAMDGKLDFSEALKERVSLLNIHQNQIQEIINILRNRVSESFLRNKNKIRSIKDRIYIVSGGFKEIIIPIVRDFGINENHVFGNDFTYNDKGFVTGISNQSPLSYSDGKIRVVKNLNLENGAYIIGDGSTDLELKQVKGISAFICFTENINRVSVSSKADYIASDLDQVFNIIDKK